MANLAIPKNVSKIISKKRTIALTPGVLTGAADNPTPSDDREWPEDVERVPIPFWDTGIFLTELVNTKQVPMSLDLSEDDRDALHTNPEALFHVARKNVPTILEEGTYRGTQLALTKVYQQIEKSYESFMDVANFEPSMPYPLSMQEKRHLFGFTDPATDGYPPHLNMASNKAYADMNPGEMQRSSLGQGDTFNKMRLAQMTALLPQLVPKTFIGQAGANIAQDEAEFALGEMGRPDQGRKIADVEAFNRAMRQRSGGLFHRNDIFNLPNIGDIEDWYTDRRFAQQFFTGPNPATIELASDFWVQHFIDNAGNTEGDQKMKAKIQDLSKNDRASLYIQDYSYFRKAAGMTEEEEIISEFEETYETGSGKQTKKSYRYGVASVCLFHLPEDGQLRPLAIVLDWRGSAQNSVTVYNKELSLSEQREDWAWRYAKTCVQCSDWLRHEVTVHLINTHFIEESCIVGAQRSFEDSHPVFQLLYPHWQKTLAINAGARNSLVPNVIVGLIGFSLEQAQTFIRNEYSKFDFKAGYVPQELASRGFDPEKRDEKKYQSYAYARCIHSMWFKIRSFVTEMLSLHYPSDSAVQEDQSIAYWCNTMQAPGGAGDTGGAGISSFPTITTFEELVDAVTMCIHIASPQHTAVNYLQNYYQSFVINKPPCLYSPVPTSRAELDRFTEEDFVEALPMNHPREWLLASHIPYLLSAKPGDKESLIIYAASKYHLYKTKAGTSNRKTKEAAAKFYRVLADSEEEFRGYGMDTWDSDDILYDVLSPSWNAVSIVI
ncbi:Linoleate 9S-lipoxygenase 2 [Lecanosticta acicola]|uniref:Manganese lipoxygenase n=1 Tax=Lecanosticta acicola TaxID=111012 RepID=A0AAI8W1M4_9PEZI|nr:Linoleate 9S-lipoxygenase 2 [Lecanosticta acicola]